MYNSAVQYRFRAVQVKSLCSLWAVGFKVRTNPPVVLQSVLRSYTDLADRPVRRR